MQYPQIIFTFPLNKKINRRKLIAIKNNALIGGVTTKNMSFHMKIYKTKEILSFILNDIKSKRAQTLYLVRLTLCDTDQISTYLYD